MSTFLIYTLAGVILFSIGLFGAISRRHLINKIIGLNIMGGGVFLLLISVARRNAGTWPDPVPHAMVLTGIVVALAASAFAITLARRIFEKTGRMELPDQVEDVEEDQEDEKDHEQAKADSDGDSGAKGPSPADDRSDAESKIKGSPAADDRSDNHGNRDEEGDSPVNPDGGNR